MTKKICSNKNQYLLPFNKGENKLKIFIRAIIAKKFTLIKATSTFILLKSITDQKYTCGEEWYHTKGNFAIAKGWLLSSAYIFTNPQKTIKLNYNLWIKNTINTIILRELSLSVEEPELALISNYTSSSCNRSLILSCSASNSGSSTLKTQLSQYTHHIITFISFHFLANFQSSSFTTKGTHFVFEEMLFITRGAHSCSL